MKILFAAAALAFAAAAPAAAAPCLIGTCQVTDTSGGAVDPLNPGNDIAIVDFNVPVAVGGSVAYEGAGAFDIGPSVIGISGLASIVFSQIVPPATQVPTGFANLTIEFFQNGGSIGAFQLTDGDGLALSQTFALAVAAGTAVEFQVLGEAFRNFGAVLPTFNINLTASEVPLPGALPLLLAGLAGLGFAARRRRGAR